MVRSMTVGAALPLAKPNYAFKRTAGGYDFSDALSARGRLTRR
ncbi:hypothetical protein DF3PB_220040 [uncultured Defluviicoccus sp.]|uniref:Uncharacterized protein n=1 Tax=metagenome TaxID=256318 RepID=A0A380TE35_9ZZZZ|nr:hypothetical protein DF3PB_220040 [uncultured Defluviicoccus sp.]